MASITVTDKTSHQSQNFYNNEVHLEDPSVIQISLDMTGIRNISREWNDLIINTVVGKNIVISNFFAIENGQQNDLLFVAGDGGKQVLWRVDFAESGPLVAGYEEVSSLNSLLSGPTPAIAVAATPSTSVEAIEPTTPVEIAPPPRVVAVEPAVPPAEPAAVVVTPPPAAVVEPAAPPVEPAAVAVTPAVVVDEPRPVLPFTLIERNPAPEQVLKVVSTPVPDTGVVTTPVASTPEPAVVPAASTPEPVASPFKVVTPEAAPEAPPVFRIIKKPVVDGEPSASVFSNEESLLINDGLLHTLLSNASQAANAVVDTDLVGNSVVSSLSLGDVLSGLQADALPALGEEAGLFIEPVAVGVDNFAGLSLPLVVDNGETDLLKLLAEQSIHII